MDDNYVDLSSDEEDDRNPKRPCNNNDVVDLSSDEELVIVVEDLLPTPQGTDHLTPHPSPPPSPQHESQESTLPMNIPQFSLQRLPPPMPQPALLRPTPDPLLALPPAAVLSVRVNDASSELINGCYKLDKEEYGKPSFLKVKTPPTLFRIQTQRMRT